MTQLPVSEIFYSIDGEGSRTGLPVIFIRLFGCNLDCSYCDSKYACKSDEGSFQRMSIDEIMAKVTEYQPCQCVTITGGEPLIHEGVVELVDTLRDKDYWINIETNGAIDLKAFKDKLEEPEFKSSMDYFFTMDWKSIYSGESSKMIPENLNVLTTNDVLKFVVANEEDLKAMTDVLSNNPELDAQVYVSPVFGTIEPKDIVSYILNHELTYVKVQIQLHKLIWAFDQRGV